tara:strand:- start:1 stop:447 length:447 start_codon:yes stop_codon:yes gene_type:complete
MISKNLLILIAFFSLILSNQKQDIVDVLKSYNKAFSEADYSKIITFFDYPASFNLSDKTITASNRFKLRLIYKKLRGGLPDYYAYSKSDKIDIQLIDDNIAIVNAKFLRYKKDSTIFYSGAAQYHFRYKDDTWKIFGLTPYKTIKNLD